MRRFKEAYFFIKNQYYDEVVIKNGSLFILFCSAQLHDDRNFVLKSLAYIALRWYIIMMNILFSGFRL